MVLEPQYNQMDNKDWTLEGESRQAVEHLKSWGFLEDVCILWSHTSSSSSSSSTSTIITVMILFFIFGLLNSKFKIFFFHS
jgi:hypothetical protein